MEEVSTTPLSSRDVPEQNVEDASLAFVGRWNRLVSTTNWEKGKIITQWREALIASGAPHADYSDEAWSRRVEGVSGQHVGRLRRVHQQFGHAQAQYAGLFWSHFQAALDWADAEMWLEGAVQNHWSVAHMRRARWETLGAVAAEEPRDADLVTALDEDFESHIAGPAADSEPSSAADAERPAPDAAEAEAAEKDAAKSRRSTPSSSGANEDAACAGAELVRPFAHLADLPADLAEAVEGFKLAILRHKTEGWRRISPDDVLSSLDALKELVTAPSDESGPF